MVKLDIGCGGAKVGQDWIGVDPYVPWSEVKADMWDLPYENESVDRIYSSHALEHISKYEVLPTLREWRRVLKPDGEIELRVPNLAWCCENWLKTQGNGWELDTIYGLANQPGEYHKTGFTRVTMTQYLNEAELRLVMYQDIWTHSQQTMRFVIRKGYGS